MAMARRDVTFALSHLDHSPPHGILRLSFTTFALLAIILSVTDLVPATGLQEIAFGTGWWLAHFSFGLFLGL
jgi:hypothetical protein